MEAVRCRFLDHVPKEIMNIAPHNNFTLVIFNDSSMHVYKTPSWTLFTAYPSVKNLELRKAIWTDSHFFVTIGLSGVLLLWTLNMLEPISSIQVPGGGIWDLDVVKIDEELNCVVACDDGVVRFYQYDERFFLVSNLPKQDSKVLATVVTHKFVFLGTANGHFVKFTSKGQCVYRMVSESSIWAILIMEDLGVTGESLGILSFWDLNTGILQQKMNTHAADILTIIEKHGEIYASGVDSKVVRCSLNESQWIITGKAKGQSHDIRSLAIVDENIVSGGVTSDICIYSSDFFTAAGEFTWNPKQEKVKFKKAQVRHITSLPFDSPVKFSHNFVVHSQGNHIDFWQIDPETHSIAKLFTINTSGNAGITCFDISPCNKWICFSSVHSFRLLKFDPESLNIEFEKVKIPPASVCEFSEEALFLAYTSLYHFKSKSMSLHLIHDFQGQFATKMCVDHSNCCVLLNNNQINIYRHYSFIFALPVLEKLISAIGFGYNKNMYFVTEDNILHGYNTKTQQPEKFTMQYSHRFPKNFLSEVNRTVGISKFLKEKLILWTHYSFSIIDLMKKPPKKCEILAKDMFPEHKNTWKGIVLNHSLHSNRKKMDAEAKNDLENFVINKRFGPILHLKIDTEKCIVFELDWEYILAVKPKPLSTHKYGT